MNFPKAPHDSVPPQLTPLTPRDSPSLSVPTMSNNSNMNGLPNVNGIQMALQIAGALMQSSQQIHQTPQQPAAGDLLNLLAMQQGNSMASTSGNGMSAAMSYAQKALNMGPPVGTYPNDEDLLVEAICESEEKGWTYRKALEGLHGVNDHLASQWKDFYLDNTQRLNKRVEFERGQHHKPIIVVKKPAFDSPTKSNDPPVQSHKGSHNAAREKSATVKLPETAAAGPSNGTSKEKGKAKEGPSSRRSPTPPEYNPLQEMKGGKNRFTDSERRYMMRYARYRLSLDPAVTKSQICQALGEKVPQHSANSWLAHWSQHRDEFDNKLPQFRAPLDVVTIVDGELHADLSDSDYEDSSDSDPEADIRGMGEGGCAITKADRRVIARYAASFGREWVTMRSNERWEPFEAMYPQRKAKSWAETYRRYEKDIERMIKRYRKQQLAEVKMQQTGRPSWATTGGDAAPHSAGKRARSSEADVDDDYLPSKRAK